jgi:hypothetical protein
VTAGQPATIRIGLALAGKEATTVHWQAVPDPNGLTVTPSTGTFMVTSANAGTDNCNASPTVPATQSLSVTAAAAGPYALRVDLSTTSGHTLPPIVIDVQAR